jgi:excinuclease ABC subunit A
MLPIAVRGARTHNLRDISCDFRPGELVVVMGPSGAGKSSLAFATLYAEGQRRFVESMSPYARQFLERLARPDVDELGPVPAAVAVDQQGEIRTSRSTVASLTDVADYAKSLWAHLATLRCSSCGAEVARDHPELVAERLLAQAPGARAVVAFTLRIADEEAFIGVRDGLVRDGYRRVSVAGAPSDLDHLRPSALFEGPRPAKGAELDVIVDRLVLRDSERSRLIEALSGALRRGHGKAKVTLEDGTVVPVAEGLVCAACGTEHPEPSPGLFSYNSPVGACEACRGFGRVMAIDWDKVLDEERPLASGGVVPWRGASTEWERKELVKHAKKQRVPMDVPLKKLTKAQRSWLVEGDPDGYPSGFMGLNGWFKWLEGRTYKMHVRVLLSRYRRYDECPACAGTRFKPAALAYRVEGRTIAELLALAVGDAAELMRTLSARAALDAAARLLLDELRVRLDTLCDVGLGYLTLDRAGNTLSSGETQRVALASALSASLSSALFVLDEPSAGLHPSDVARLCKVVRRLADAGNAVLVVAHDPQMLAVADRVLELGPGAGVDGGHIVFDGTPRALLDAGTLTARALGAPYAAPEQRQAARAELVLSGASGHNLKSVTLRVGLGQLTCVTGPSGSGKTSLVLDTLAPAVEAALGERAARPLPFGELSGARGVSSLVLVEKSALGRTSRGNPATYLGAWEVLRKRFASSDAAKARGFSAGTFSFNVEGGRCEACKGQGYETVEMQFLADVSFECPECGGKRFVGPVLDVRHRGKNPAEWLELTANEALAEADGDPELARTLAPLAEVGLGYLRLGQPLNTVSGGEAQRLRLAEAFRDAKPGALLILDEPTSGLHPNDVAPVLAVLRRLVARGDTVIAIEHDMRVAAAADRVIDMGPGAGAHGGEIVAEGTPEEVARGATRSSRYLAQALRGRVELPAAQSGPRTLPPPAALEVVRAREHNLRSVSVSLPRTQLIAVTGPSGSGKSSLAFGVIHAEAQRRFIETLSPYARQYLPQLPRPDVDRVTNVEPSIALEQRVTRAGATSTVATMTELAHFLRLLFARVGVPVGKAREFAARQGAAEVARLVARRAGDAEARVFARVVSGRKGIHRELLTRAYERGTREARIDGKLVRLTEGMALSRYQEHDIDLLVGAGSGPALGPLVSRAARDAEGQVLVLVGKDELVFSVSEGASHEQKLLDPRLFSFNTRQGACEACEGKGYLVEKKGRGKKAREERTPCAECEGTRLSELARSFVVAGMPITRFLAASVGEARALFQALRFEGRDALIAEPIVDELVTRSGFLERLGLGYLGLDRSADTLSGGETQRVRLSAQLGSGLTGVLYVLDEPTIGLHPRDTALLVAALRELVRRGNTALVVEHDLEMIAAAELVLDMGPSGGKLGGSIVAMGSPDQLRADPSSPTGRALAQALPERSSRGLDGVDWLEVRGAREHNLKDVDARFPLGRFSAVTGVSGSGKSTLLRTVVLPAVREALRLANDVPPGRHKKLLGASKLKRAVEVDQSPIGRTPRSVPATYIGIWDEIRRLLAGTQEARARGYDASRFSFNLSEGRCPTCEGNGALTVEMSFLPDALVPCDGCRGRRFNAETLQVTYAGLSAGEILDLEVDQAVQVFSAVRSVATPLRMLSELGLGYLKLGQPSSTLSGGEAQRMKLVAELGSEASGPTLYVLDEPTTGLSRHDVTRLIQFLERFVARGDTLILIEHHVDVMAAADYLLDMGPEGGAGGGRVVAAGAPSEIALADSATGRALRDAFGAVPPRSGEAPKKKRASRESERPRP